MQASLRPSSSSTSKWPEMSSSAMVVVMIVFVLSSPKMWLGLSEWIRMVFADRLSKLGWQGSCECGHHGQPPPTKEAKLSQTQQTVSHRVKSEVLVVWDDLCS